MTGWLANLELPTRERDSMYVTEKKSDRSRKPTVWAIQAFIT